MDSKYGNRKFLCEYNLSTELFDHAGLRVKDLYPLKKGYIIECDDNVFYMKKIQDEDNIKMLRYLIENHIEFSNDYSIFTIRYNDEIYYFLSINSNKTATVNDIKKISSKLASIHRNCVASSTILSSNIVNKNFKEELNEAFDKILYYKKIVDKYAYKNEFDNNFLVNAESILNEINIINNELVEVKHLYDNERFIRCLCLESIDYNDILVKEDECFFIDIEENYLSVGSINLAEFILCTLSYLNYDVKIAKEIIEEYDKINNLKDIDYKLMYVYFKYPKDSIQLIDDYYDKKQVFNEKIFLNKFNRILELNEAKKLFLSWFYKEYIESIN